MTKLLLGAAAGVFLLSAPAQAQDVNAECGLRGADTILVGGASGKQCLDIQSLKGKNVVIPSNVTRIDNTGFALCQTSESTGGQADIVYVLDQSGSMDISYAWISPDKRDTVYLQGLDNCGFANSDLNGFGTLTIPNATTVRTIPILNPAKSPASCTNTSGDPFTQRGVAFKEAIEFQAQRAPNSTAGYLGFSGSVLDAIRPRTLSTQANINQIESKIILHYGNGTNYTAPLDSAKRWLLNPAIASNPTQAIIFLSDGRPSPSDRNGLAVIEANYAGQPGKMPPVYGILLGKPSADTAMLDSISRKTGGKFFLIPPSRPDSLKSVVAGILNVILRQYRPVGAVVTNNSTAPAVAGTAGAGDFTKQTADSWLLNLDKNVPLLKGQGNQIKVNTLFLDQTGQSRADSATFTLTTTGPAEGTNKNLIGTPFSVVCVDLPPPIDPVKVAYIRDVNGDGAGDQVVLVFAKPLAALPSSLDAYWNTGEAISKNKLPPVLSFLTASNNTVVLADFSAPGAAFPVGLTGIPTGAAPVAVLPAGGVFGGQRPPIEDSIGPILMTGTLKPFLAVATQPAGELGLDTLTITTSEPIRSQAQWNTVLLWSKATNGKCEDFAHAMPVVPAGNPVVDAGMTKVTVYLSGTSGAPAPSKGDCVYLNVDGTYTDLKFNVPPVHGVVLEGPPRPNQIALFRGYPPVAGLTADKPGFVVSTQDPRKGNEFTSYSVKDSLGQFGPPGTPPGKYVTTWIPPVGFIDHQPFQSIIPPLNAPATGTELTGPRAMPSDISTVQVVSSPNTKYIADVWIYDNRGVFVKSFKQAFGYQGELGNRYRIAPKGQVSYLVWDLMDSRNQKAGQGVYIWKVFFTFDNGKQQVQYTRTGLVGRKIP